MIKRIVLILALLLIFFCIWCLPYDLTERESLEKAYAKGRDNFYAALKKMATNAQLEETDRKKILNAQKRISGLYEHLMNFYYFTKQGDRAKDDISGHIIALTDRLAEEFVNSIPSRRWTKDTSPLESILLSIGFHARKATPQFRKFLRPMTRLAKSNWLMKELEIHQAHSITKGKGVRLAIIDTGVDPTIKEVKGQIAPGVEMMIVKVFDQETMFHAPFTRWNVYLIAAGINWAAQNGADVISLSVAIRLNYKEIRNATEYCWRQNITLISAAGNVEDKKSELHAYYPASYPWSIGVGGVEKKDGKLKVWEHSAKGYFIDVVAATTSLVLSAMEPETRRTLKHNPGALVEAVRSILRETSSNKKLGYIKPNPKSGFGLINAYQAAKIAQVLKIKE